MKTIARILAAVAALLVASPAFAQIDTSARGMAGSITQAKASDVTSNAQMETVGNSLTCGNQDGSGTTIYGSLAPKVGLAIYANPVTGINVQCIGGQTSNQIALRDGAIQLTVTLSGNQITATNNSVTALNGVALAGMTTAQTPDYRVLSTIGDLNTRYMTGTLCGVYGSLKRTASGGPPSTSETYVFIPNVKGMGVQYVNALVGTVSCPANSVFTPDSASLWGVPARIEAGRNDYAQTATVEANIQAMVNKRIAAGNNRYLVLSILNGDYSGEQSGQGNYSTITAENAWMAATFPGHYFDWRSWLISQYDPTNPVDVLNHTNDVVPLSLRAVIGTGTLNGALGTTGCPVLSPTTGSPGASQTLVLTDSSPAEYIYVTTTSGNTVTACTRGYGTGGVASAHSSGVAYSAKDPLHVSGVAGAMVAAYEATNFGSLYTGGQKYATPGNIGSLLYAPPAIGIGGPNYGIFAGLQVTGNNTMCVHSIVNNVVAANPCLGSNANGDFLANANRLSPQFDAASSLGSSTARWKDGNFKGTFSNLGTIAISSTANFAFSGTAPTLSSCGTSPSIDSHATAASGTVTFGSGSPTTCTLTFPASTFATYAHCRVNFETALTNPGYAVTTSTITFTASALSGSADYQCDGQ